MATRICKGWFSPPPIAVGEGKGSWFGGSPPAYAVPAPKPVAAVTTTTQTPTAAGVVGTCDSDRITLVISRELIGSQQLIVIASPDGNVSSDDTERITLMIPRSLIRSRQQQKGSNRCTSSVRIASSRVAPRGLNDRGEHDGRDLAAARERASGERAKAFSRRGEYAASTRPWWNPSASAISLRRRRSWRYPRCRCAA